MGDIFSYLEWRGDIDFTEVGVRYADYLVFCGLSYFSFDGIVSSSLEAEPMKLKAAVKAVLAMSEAAESETGFSLKDDKRMLKVLPKCARFTHCRLAGFVNKCDVEKEEQFSAITIIMPNGNIAVAFRGTDNSIVGWKEDFNMGYLDDVPSRLDAAEYLNSVGAAFPKARIYVTGHSKGGNLAMYAAAFCDKSVQDRIEEVRNLDGPGFSDEILSRPGIQEIKDRTVAILPQESIVGLLLGHFESYRVVHSNEPKPISQHYLYSWEIRRADFVEEDGLTQGSRFIDTAVTDWVRSLDIDLRRKMVEGIFKIVNSTDAATSDDVFSGRNTLAMINAFAKTDDETKNTIITAYKLLKDSIKKNITMIMPSTEGAEDDDAEPMFTADWTEDVRIIGRAFVYNDTLWMSYSGSGIEFKAKDSFSVVLKGDDMVHAEDADIHFARYAVFRDGVMMVDDRLDESEKELSFEEKGTHVFRIIKLSESNDSSLGIESISSGSRIRPTEAPKLKIEFVGDSITCGYGVDGDLTQKYTTATEDVTKAWAYRLATKLGADYSIVAKSGSGVLSGYTATGVMDETNLLPPYYEKMGCSLGHIADGISPQDFDYDFAFEPDLIFINFGTNDVSYCHPAAELEIPESEQLKRSVEFKLRYRAFIEQIRSRNPEARICCTLEDLERGLHDEVREAVEELRAEGDKKLYWYYLERKRDDEGNGTDYHPTPITQERFMKTAYEFYKKIRSPFGV